MRKEPKKESLSSSSAINLTLSGFLKARLLSLYTSWVALEKFEILEWASSSCIEGLEGLSHCWDASLTLASHATATDNDIDVKHASVARHS